MMSHWLRECPAVSCSSPGNERQLTVVDGDVAVLESFIDGDWQVVKETQLLE